MSAGRVIIRKVKYMQTLMWLLIALPVLLVAGRFWGRLIRKGIGAVIRFAEGNARLRDLAAVAMDAAPYPTEMKNVLRTPAGKGMLAAFFMALLLVWPSALSWLVASVLLTYAVVQFARAYRQAERRSGLMRKKVTFDNSSARTDVDVGFARDRRFPPDA